MSIPTRGETFSKLLEHIRLAEEDAAMMAHLHNADANAHDRLIAKGWLTVSEALRLMGLKVTQIAQGRLQ
jgi:hypothetical protein